MCITPPSLVPTKGEFPLVGEDETVGQVKIGVGSLQVLSKRILKILISKTRRVVQRMRVSIGAEEPQSIVEASVQGHLQRVVAGVGGGVLKKLVLKDVGVPGTLSRMSIVLSGFLLYGIRL